MSTPHAQAARTTALIFFAALPLAGCAPSVDSVYRVNGAATDFCVPWAIDATPARPNQERIVSGGFAMNGCWHGEGGSCIGSEMVLSLSVSDKASFVGMHFGDFPAESHLKVAANQGLEKAAYLGDGVIVIPDSVDDSKIFIWSVGSADRTRMVGEDTFELTCRKSPEVGGYICNRQVAADDYLLGYSFVSKKLPTKFNTLDSSVKARIEELRCPGTR